MWKYAVGLVLFISATFVLGFGSGGIVLDRCRDTPPAHWPEPGASGSVVRVEGPRTVGWAVPWGAWIPSADEIREMEHRLPAFLASDAAWRAVSGRVSRERWLLLQATLTNYARVYCGGRERPREMYVWFSYSPDRNAGDAIRGLGAFGGGDRYFNVAYQVQPRRFIRLRVNSAF